MIHTSGYKMMPLREAKQTVLSTAHPSYCVPISLYGNAASSLLKQPPLHTLYTERDTIYYCWNYSKHNSLWSYILILFMTSICHNSSNAKTVLGMDKLFALKTKVLIFVFLLLSYTFISIGTKNYFWILDKLL